MIVIFVRMTEDWENCTIDKLRDREGNKAGYKYAIDATIKKVEEWDCTMKIPYFKYRSMTKALAESTCKNYRICYDVDELKNLDDNDLICPADDDNWFREDLLDVIPREMGTADFLYWDQVVHMTTKFAPHRWYQYHDVLSSNNYCARAKLVKAMRDKDRHNFLYYENVAQKVVERMRARTPKIEDLLSCYPWHIGSVSFMLQNDFANMHVFLQDYEIQDEEMKWTQPYYNQLAELNNSLKKSKLF